MASLMNAREDIRVAAHIQELREEAARSCKLDVYTGVSRIKIYFEIPGEELPPKHIKFNAQQNEPQYEQLLTAIGEILAQGHAQLQNFYLAQLNCQNNGYSQFWRGLAANQVLKEVCFYKVYFPDEPDGTRFLANPALDSLGIVDCMFPHGTFDSLCQGIQSSHIKKLRISSLRLPQEASWSLLWSALEHGATCLESLRLGVSNDATHGAENGFESFLANNTTIQSLRLESLSTDRGGLPLFVALGRVLAVNTTVKILDLSFPNFLGNPAIEELLIQTVFSEGLDENMAVESLTVETNLSPEAVNALANGLERMMRNRANAATHDGHGQEESLPVLKELAVHFDVNFRDLRATTDAAHDLFFDRLSRSDVILVEKLEVVHPYIGQLSSPKVYDFIRSTKVTKSLELSGRPRLPDDNTPIDLADAMEANNSISELKAGLQRFDTTTNLWTRPNRYRIRCQCRRNEIQVHMLRKAENLSLLPSTLARLLSLDDRPADDEECQKIEARQLVDRTIAYEMLKDIPALFAIYGKQKRED